MFEPSLIEIIIYLMVIARCRLHKLDFHPTFLLSEISDALNCVRAIAEESSLSTVLSLNRTVPAKLSPLLHEWGLDPYSNSG